MEMRGRVLLSAVAAVGIAGAVLGISFFTGIPLTNTSLQATKLGAPSTLAVMLTDPPSVPEGVTAVFVSYGEISLHFVGAGNASGWTTISTGGSIDLLSTVSVGQTVAAAKLPDGRYNAFRLDVTSAQVTYSGKNYTADLVNPDLFIPILRGGVVVNASTPSGALIQISPLVMNVGSSDAPAFVIRGAAVAFPVPSGFVTEEMDHVGFRLELAGRDWWQSEAKNSTAVLKVTNASLSNDSLSITVQDLSRNATVKYVIVSSTSSFIGGSVEDRVPSGLWGTAVFVVEKNGTLLPLRQYLGSQPGNHTEAEDEIAQGFGVTGFSMAAGMSTTFTYSGQVTLGFSLSGRYSHQVVAGQAYLVTVIGTDSLVSEAVVAS